jgi:8-oxo-dGTP pyrophosphatase MutT (NUDIX family)
MIPAPPVPSATIILKREKGKEFEIYLLRRSSKSGFMGGYYVFPGGMTDAEDEDEGFWEAHGDLDSAAVNERFGGELFHTSPMAFLVSAIRETVEEAGVFLLASGKDKIPGELERIRHMRASGNLARGWFMAQALERDWRISFSALRRWSHWITPELMKRRYDTRFFIADMPAGQVCTPDAKETTHGLWMTPKEALDANMRGDIPLSPPTLVTLQSLLQYATGVDLDRALEIRHWGATIMPRLVPLEKTAVIVEPWDPDYHSEKIGIPTTDMSERVLPVGEPFSRLWLCEGIWKPVSF